MNRTKAPASWFAIYRKLARAGFTPTVVYDIGAAHACWSSEIVKLFPRATYYLFEPLAQTVPSYREALVWARLKHPLFHVHCIAVGETTGRCTIAIGPTPAASTTLDIGDVFPEKKTVPLHSLDDLQLPLAQLLKLDVQGSEDCILRGAQQTLASAQVLQIECWLTPAYGPETALMTDIIKMLADAGFIPFESSDPYYSEGRLCAIDLYFLHQDLAEKWEITPLAHPQTDLLA